MGFTISIEKDLLKSEAYKSLSKSAILIYNDFLMKRQLSKQNGKIGKNRWVITNNGEIEFTYSEAEKKGYPRSTFMRCITELVKKGFIDIQHSGSGGVKGDKSLYGISTRWQKWGTKDFIKKTRQKDQRSGRGFSKGNTFWKIGVKNGTYMSAKNDTQIDNLPL